MVGPNLLWLFLAVAPPVSQLGRAREDLKRLDFAAVLQDVRNLENADLPLTRDEVIELFELRGIAEGSLGLSSQASESFVSLLALDPDHMLKGRASPKFMTPFLEARAVIREEGPLGLEIKVVDPAASVVRGVTLRRTGARRAWLSRAQLIVSDDAGSRAVELPFGGDSAELAVNGATVSIAVQAFSARGWSLLSLSEVRLQGAPAPAPIATMPPVTTRQVEPPVAAVAANRPNRLAPVAFGVAGLAAGVVSVVFLGLAGGAAGSLRNPQLAQPEALLSAARNGPVFERIGWAALITSGALVAASVVLFVIGTPHPMVSVRMIGLHSNSLFALEVTTP